MGSIVKDITNYLKPQQVIRMLKTTRDSKEWLLIFLLWRTGRRVSELLLLRPRHIDYDDNMIKWKILKKRKKTIAWKACDHDTISTLRYYIMQNQIDTDSFIFESQRINKRRKANDHLTRKWAFSVVRNATERAGILYKEGKIIKDHLRCNAIIVSSPGWHPHHLRHSFAINYLKNVDSPAGLTMLQEHLGHSNVSTTQAYLQFSQRDRVEMLNRVFRTENLK